LGTTRKSRVAVNLGDSSRICRSSDIFPLLAPTTGVKESGGFKIEREREREVKLMN
jgi:hypothetical protein